jgi:hypothetical protein
VERKTKSNRRSFDSLRCASVAQDDKVLAAVRDGNISLSRSGRCALLEVIWAAYIGMGGNVRGVAETPAAVGRLGTLGTVVYQSSLYSTEPAGFRSRSKAIPRNWVSAVQNAAKVRSVTPRSELMLEKVILI